ncbi:MAG: hypothetical protein AB7E37_07130 [Candidatus Altimarinota bacterium]
MDTSTLKNIKTRYDASKVFAKGKKIFFYFNATHKEDNTYKYYLFNPVFSFNKNFDLIQEKFKDIKGYWYLYTNNEKYPAPITKQQKAIQLELF